MAFNFTFNPNEYEVQEFVLIPEGDIRVRIADVVEKTFNSGNSGFEITLDVSGYSAKLWQYIIIDPNDSKKTNQRLGAFFDSFGITHYDLNAFKSWIGKIGAVRVFHDEYNGNKNAKVKFVIARKRQDSLPAWKEPNGGSQAQSAPTIDIKASDLPF